MSDIETVIRFSREIEALLESRLGADGRGLHQKLNAVEGDLPERIVKRARFIASVRNAVLHEEGATIRDRTGLEDAHAEVVAFLKQFKRPGLKRTFFVSQNDGGAGPPRPPRQWAGGGNGMSRLVFVLGLILLGVVAIGIIGARLEETRDERARPEIALPQLGR